MIPQKPAFYFYTYLASNSILNASVFRELVQFSKDVLGHTPAAKIAHLTFVIINLSILDWHLLFAISSK
jgi:hypothetical protein